VNTKRVGEKVVGTGTDKSGTSKRCHDPCAKKLVLCGRYES